MRFNKLSLIVLSLVVTLSCQDSDTSGSFADSSSTGQAGSMTRFAINGNYMYVVDNSAVKVFNITAGKFQQIREVSIGFGMETIFAKGDYLYLGANDAMYIYSIADAEHPTFVFRYAHIVSCDPVVVQGNRAYVTLRGGSFCNRGTNALEIIDISDPYDPKLIKNYPMESPYGLGIDNKLLFICEGEKGLKVFDITEEQNIRLAAHLTDFFAYDIIARQGTATITGEDGIFQYSYNYDASAVNLLSKIPVTRGEL
jgi:hypothetical protein